MRGAAQQHARPVLTEAKIHYGCQVVKRIWAYVKEHDLQNPKDKRKIILDDVLGKIFKVPCKVQHVGWNGLGTQIPT